MKELKDHNYFGIDVTIIADSKGKDSRCTSFVLSFPRIILAEFNTHRVISRNSASSRAVPFEKMLERVKQHPFIPIRWMKDHSGMQGNEYFNEADTADILSNWLSSRDLIVNRAKELNKIGVTKQIVNRLLEPFQWHTIIATATEWENFFALRAHDAAEIHMQALAYKMLEEYNSSTPKLLEKDEWHIPFSNDIDEGIIYNNFGITSNEAKIKIATARCARVSYYNFEGKDNYEADIKLHDRLTQSGHWSPFEHCAQSTDTSDYYGNFKGFKQYRKFFDKENKKDSRVLNK